VAAFAEERRRWLQGSSGWLGRLGLLDCQNSIWQPRATALHGPTCHGQTHGCGAAGRPVRLPLRLVRQSANTHSRANARPQAVAPAPKEQRPAAQLLLYICVMC